jgi:hypothetical protein
MSTSSAPVATRPARRRLDALDPGARGGEEVSTSCGAKATDG